MSDYTFEAAATRQLRRLREARRDGSPPALGYVGPQGGRVLPMRGDEDAPYLHMLGRASNDGTDGAPAVLATESQRVLTDPFGAIWTRQSLGSNVFLYHSSVAETEAVVEATGSHRVFEARMIIDTGVNADRFLQLHETAAALAGGEEPIWEAFVPAASGYAEVAESFAGVGGLDLNPAIHLANSTTPGVYTAPAVDEAFFELIYGNY